MNGLELDHDDDGDEDLQDRANATAVAMNVAMDSCTFYTVNISLFIQ